ncbi:ASCH/PUA domain-containing protein [Aneurinibacillus migulanus]|uniref:DUF3850 domain-containing protein n=1 Tax=Aneurinibacillus migulanus TaxID=47500 RepID=A0A1G8WJ10_ANEMI|nr:ASCH/PUA domain-containing protein [Aneurinibacillus migulanus]GED14838.1 hypothetical protein AMI01nite_28290 [Aneurinibacillus migulanus]SDJ78106.1 protein of unknown function [Aneurinibacillus migulanus]
MANVHFLKTWPEYFQAVFDGNKAFEIRKNDRNFAVGDWVVLKEWCPEKQAYTDREVAAEIMYMTNYEQKDGYVVLSIKPTKERAKAMPKWVLDIARKNGLSKQTVHYRLKELGMDIVEAITRPGRYKRGVK